MRLTPSFEVGFVKPPLNRFISGDWGLSFSICSILFVSTFLYEKQPLIKLDIETNIYESTFPIKLDESTPDLAERQRDKEKYGTKKLKRDPPQ